MSSRTDQTSQDTMQTRYEPHQIESQWYEFWESHQFFKTELTADQTADDAYCIMLPPPNVTGTLHMGHAFQHTIMDILIRFQKMQGKTVLWQGGTDHAGIATQMIVERQLAALGQTKQDLGREGFLDKAWAWKAQSGNTISRQMRRLGNSIDWSRECFTLDPELSKAVQEVFVQLYREKLIYRGQRLVNWDPKLLTAVSDLEVINQEEQGSLWHLRYPLVESVHGLDHLVVATTRPETMLGDAAIAVHPDDERYQALIGQQVQLPLTNRTIPVIADHYVDPAFGSGCVKITPAHDFNDYAVGQRHDLPLLNILNPDASLNDQTGNYQGMDRYAARQQIIEDLQALDLIDKIEPHKLMVPRGDRSQSVIEPYLTDQWYVDVKCMSADAVRAVENKQTQFIPENWQKTFYNWMNDIQDWCISRQLWWGHRIPAWYDAQGQVYVGYNESEVRQHYQLDDQVKLTQDDDVLDTWFSSALWPFSTLGWPQNTDNADAFLKAFYPTNVLVTGFDIIFFWVARMMMMGLKFMQAVPFQHVYITGLILDENGQKMSKSKGNIIDPIDLIDGIDLESLVSKRTQGLMQPEMAKKIEANTRKQFAEGIPSFGTDALRFTLAALATNGREIRFDLQRVEGYRNFCNKLWNASRYVLMNTQEYDTRDESISLSLADRWIISCLQQTEAAVSKYIDTYRFDLAAKTLYDFVWNDYCDWYIELSKPALNSTGDRATSTRQTLVRVLEATLRLAHPIIPFITESIWQKVAPYVYNEGALAELQQDKPLSILSCPYPVADHSKIDQQALDDMAWIQRFVSGIRQIRSEMDISPAKRLPLLLNQANEKDRTLIDSYTDQLMALCRLESIEYLTGKAPESAMALVDDLQLLIPLAGLIDKQAELDRLNQAIQKAQAEIKRLQGKLSNDKFVNRAPPEVVEAEREKLSAAQKKYDQLYTQQQKIAAL